MSASRSPTASSWATGWTTASATATCRSWPRWKARQLRLSGAAARGRSGRRIAGKTAFPWYARDPVAMAQRVSGPPGFGYEPFLQERRLSDPDRGRAGVPRGETRQPGVTEPPQAQLPDPGRLRAAEPRSQLGGVQEQGQSPRSQIQKQ